MIEAKAAGETVSPPAPADTSARVVDLMTALEASVKAAKERRAGAASVEAPADSDVEETKPAKSRRKSA
jgi:DNA end-binding protein Ku